MKRLNEAYQKVLTSFFDTEDAKNWPKDRPWPGIDTREMNLVIEDKHLEVNIGQEALGYLKSNLKEDILMLLDNEILKKKILPQWKHYRDFCICCMNKKIWMLESDFFSHLKAKRILKSKLNVTIDLKGSMTGTNGLTIPISLDEYVVIIDKSANERRILHEFTHCVQLIANKVTKCIDGLAEEIKKYFSIDKSLEDYVFNQHEFWANVFNDLFNDMQKNYWLHHKEMSWEEYVDILAYDLKNYSLNYMNSLLGKEWEKDDCSFLFLDLLACIAYVNPSFFDEIIDKLKNK